jgi:hypothetical protein
MLNPDLSQNLRDLRLAEFPVGNQNHSNIHIFFKSQHHLPFTEFVKWILPLCSNTHTLKIHLIHQPNDLHNEIARLKKLKDLYIGTRKEIHPEEVTCVAFSN